jgi:hypothetical protein
VRESVCTLEGAQWLRLARSMGPPFRFVSGTWKRKYRLLPKRYILIKIQRWTEFQQDRQCTYNVTLGLAHATIVAAEEQVYIFWERVCSLRHPACKAHARYCHLWPLRHYSINVEYPLVLSDFNETWVFRTDFRKTLKHQISLNFQWEPSCSMRTDVRTVAFRYFANAPENDIFSDHRQSRIELYGFFILAWRYTARLRYFTCVVKIVSEPD